MGAVKVDGDRVVYPPFSTAEVRPASRLETLCLVVISFGTAALMLYGAYHFGKFILSFI